VAGVEEEEKGEEKQAHEALEETPALYLTLSLPFHTNRKSVV